MCGIAGIFGRADSARVTGMLDRQRHRGPDGRGLWTDPGGRACLGHDRLSIVDVAGGAQPIPNEDGASALVLNGEIYNFRALKAGLGKRHGFRTRSDSEVVIHLFEEEETACLPRLDGMFAVAIAGPHGLFLARDPLGIKPLYYGWDSEGNLLFASEIKALMDEVAAVVEFPAGHAWLLPAPDRSLPGPVRYYSVPWPTTDLDDLESCVTALDHMLQTAVAKRLMAEVPLGVFLSGGLDSSLLAALVRRQTVGPLHSFVVGMEGSEDLRLAREAARFIGTIHHERVLTTADLTAALPKVIDLLESCDPALVRSAVPTYYVSQLAADWVKVVLSGEGADELFAGYDYLSEFDGTPFDLSAELYHITCNLHNTNLQRVDRMTMAQGLEGRVPFLDKAMVDLAFRMETSLKRRCGEGKWVLRRVAARYLPDDIVWRKKEKFAMGTGIGPALEQHAETVSAGREPAGRSPEEGLYWSFFRRRYGRPEILRAMGRSRSLNPGQRWTPAL